MSPTHYQHQYAPSIGTSAVESVDAILVEPDYDYMNESDDETTGAEKLGSLCHWNCYNCGENSNRIIQDSHCKDCGLGINPFQYLILNGCGPRKCEYAQWLSYMVLGHTLDLFKANPDKNSDNITGAHDIDVNIDVNVGKGPLSGCKDVTNKFKQCQLMNLTPKQSVYEMSPLLLMNCDHNDNNPEFGKNKKQHLDSLGINKPTNVTTTHQVSVCADTSNGKAPIVPALAMSPTNAPTKVAYDVNGNSNTNATSQAQLPRNNNNSHTNSTPTKSRNNNPASGDRASKPDITISTDSGRFKSHNEKQIFTFYVVFNCLEANEENKKDVMRLIQGRFERSGNMYRIGEAVVCHERFLAIKVGIYSDDNNDCDEQLHSADDIECIFRCLQDEYKQSSLFGLEKLYEDVVNGFRNENCKLGSFGLGSMQKYEDNIDRYVEWLYLHIAIISARTQRAGWLSINGSIGISEEISRAGWLSIKDRIDISEERYSTLMQYIKEVGLDKLKDEINDSEVLKCRNKLRNAFGVYSFKVEQCNFDVPVAIIKEREVFEQEFVKLTELSVLIDIIALSFTVKETNERQCKRSSIQIQSKTKTENLDDVKNDGVDGSNGNI